MEDLREQKQDQWMTTDGKATTWEISLEKDNLFNETSTRSLHIVNNNPKVESHNDNAVIMDDDRNIFDVYLKTAQQDLTILLAKRMADTDGITDTEDKMTYTLTMGINHDSNTQDALKNSCKEFLVKKVLEQWFMADFGSEAEKQRLTHILQCRRKSVARRVRPLL